MLRSAAPLAAIACVLTLSLGTASAQRYPGPHTPAYGYGYRPGLSPYLDIVNRGPDPGINYYLGTLPEIDRRANARFFSSAIADLEARPPVVAGTAPDADLFTPLPSTGHPTAFGTTGGYFPGPPRVGLTTRPGYPTGARPR
jgi:hypothetical protein